MTTPDHLFLSMQNPLTYERISLCIYVLRQALSHVPRHKGFKNKSGICLRVWLSKKFAPCQSQLQLVVF